MMQNFAFRLWGKILGNPKNYYIAEANLSVNELERRLEVICTYLQSKTTKRIYIVMIKISRNSKENGKV